MQQTPRFARLFVIAGATFLVALVLLLLSGLGPAWASSSGCDSNGCYLLDTTTNDFVKGTFYGTGLRDIGDGEVQLLPVGLTSAWVDDSSHHLPGPRAELSAVTFGDIIYVIGGLDSSFNLHTEIYSATTSVNGAITQGWTQASSLPAGRAGASAVVSTTTSGGVLYVIGGIDTSTHSTNTIWYKTMGRGGGLGSAWVTSTVQLPVALAYSTAVVNNGFLYVIGGSDVTTFARSEVYRFHILDASGTLDNPVDDLALPKELKNLAAVVWHGESGDFVYVIGGLDYFNNGSQDVYYTSFNSDGSLGSPWQNVSLVNAFNSHGAVQTNGVIHVVGGRSGFDVTTAISQVQSSLIDTTGGLHLWSDGKYWLVTQPLPEPRQLHGTVVNPGGELYVIGGYNASGVPQATVYHGSTTGFGSRYAPSGSYTSQPIDAGSGNHFDAIDWNAVVTDTSQMTMTFQYRTSNTATGLDAVTQTWTLAGNAAQSGSGGITNTVSIPVLKQTRYLQYQVLMTTTITDTSPVLNGVRVDYPQPPTPVPTATPPGGGTPQPTPIPGQYPDFMITGMQVPEAPASGSTLTQTIGVWVLNRGTLPYKPERAAAYPTVILQPRPLVLPTPRPRSAIRSSTAYTDTTNYFFYVSVYVDPSAPITQTTAAASLCVGARNENFAPFVYGGELPIGSVARVDAECPVTGHGDSSPNVFWAQADTCSLDDFNNGYCSDTYGRIQEKLESNNIFGPIDSGSTVWPWNTYFPVIRK